MNRSHGPRCSRGFYEIAGYGTFRAWAEELGLTTSLRLLQATLDEEKDADQKLSEIAARV